MQRPTSAVEKVQILGTNIDYLTMDQAIQKAEDFIREGTPHRIVTLNAEMAYLAYTDQQFQQLVNTAHLVTADGSGVVWAAEKKGISLPEKIAGIDLMLALTTRAAVKGYKIFLYGAAPGTAEEAAQKLQEKYSQLEIAGIAHGYLDAEEQKKLIKQIRETAPDMLFVALGAPRQDQWLAENLEHLGVPVCMGVGGSFDVIAGHVKRAPKFWQNLQLEWLYRILKEPKRLKRSMALPKFMWAVITKAGKS